MTAAKRTARQERALALTVDAVTVAARALNALRARLGRIRHPRRWTAVAVIVGTIGYFHLGWPAPKLSILTILIVALVVVGVIFGLRALHRATNR